MTSTFGRVEEFNSFFFLKVRIIVRIETKANLLVYDYSNHQNYMYEKALRETNDNE